MRPSRAWALGVVVGALAVAVLAGAPAQASGFIEWNPQTGFYWTETPQPGATLRLVGGGQGYLETLFQVLTRMPLEEQRQLAQQLQTQAPSDQGAAVVEAPRAVELMGAQVAEQVRTRLEIERRSRSGDDDADEDLGGVDDGEEDMHEQSQDGEQTQTELKERHEERTGQTIGSQSSQSGSDDDSHDESIESSDDDSASDSDNESIQNADDGDHEDSAENQGDDGEDNDRHSGREGGRDR